MNATAWAYLIGAAACGLSVLAAPLPLVIQVSILLIGLLLSGILHGAFDALLVAKRSGKTPGARFYLGYVATALGFVALWWWLPAVALTLFLLLSVHHFGAGDAIGSGRWAQILARGSALIVLSAGGQAHATAPLYALLLRQPDGTIVTDWLSATPVLLAFAVALLIALLALLKQRDTTARLSALELIALCIAAWYAPPLLSFAAFFCASHAPRHVLRCAQELHPERRVAAAFWQMVRDARWVAGASLFGALMLLPLWIYSGNPALMLGIFVGLAALTLPHAYWVDR